MDRQSSHLSSHFLIAGKPLYLKTHMEEKNYEVADLPEDTVGSEAHFYLQSVSTETYP